MRSQLSKVITFIVGGSTALILQSLLVVPADAQTTVLARGFQLTPEQAQQLGAASRSGYVSMSRAEQIVGASPRLVSGGGRFPQGSGVSFGSCGTAQLRAYSSGYYHLVLHWYGVGNPQYGSAYVTTNAFVSSSDYWWLGGSTSEAFTGYLYHWGGIETYSDAWSVTDGGYYCGYHVAAFW